jgi:uncharacterized protein YjiS (DUF1127 family)
VNVNTCCDGRYEIPRGSLAGSVSHLFRAACLALVARRAALRAQVGSRREARRSFGDLRRLNDRELQDIGIMRPTWWVLDRGGQGFGAQSREP